MLVQVWMKWNLSNPESFNNVKWFWMKSAMNHWNYASLSQQRWPHARAVVIHRLHRLCTVTKIGTLTKLLRLPLLRRSWMPSPEENMYFSAARQQRALASMTATAAKTSLLERIRVFSNFVASIPIRWKCLQVKANFPRVDFLGDRTQV